jgi:hypothetical protein
MRGKYLSASYLQRREHAMTPRGELDRLLTSSRRANLVKSGAKLFCRECQSLQTIVDVFGAVAKLECSHRREITPGLGAQIARLEKQITDAHESAHGETA